MSTIVAEKTFSEKVVEVLDNHIAANLEELNEAKVKFADCKLRNDHDTAYKYRDKCNVLQGQQDILEVIKGNILRILSGQ